MWSITKFTASIMMLENNGRMAQAQRAIRLGSLNSIKTIEIRYTTIDAFQRTINKHVELCILILSLGYRNIGTHLITLFGDKLYMAGHE